MQGINPSDSSWPGMKVQHGLQIYAAGTMRTGPKPTSVWQADTMSSGEKQKKSGPILIHGQMACASPRSFCVRGNLKTPQKRAAEEFTNHQKNANKYLWFNDLERPLDHGIGIRILPPTKIRESSDCRSRHVLGLQRRDRRHPTLRIASPVPASGSASYPAKVRVGFGTSFGQSNHRRGRLSKSESRFARSNGHSA
jgi:hypothetical protein